jgi:uncharacterized protein (TIGR02466 family)
LISNARAVWTPQRSLDIPETPQVGRGKSLQLLNTRLSDAALSRSMGPVMAAKEQPVKAGAMPLFSTWIYQCADGPRHLNARLEQLARSLMREERNAARRTNCGGWHYAFDLFKLEDPVVPEFRAVMEQHVQGFLNHFRPEERTKHDRFQLKGWINVNRAGDHNLLHCHPGCLLSAVYYVHVPREMNGGQIFFRDPRGPAVAMVESPHIELPWVGSGVGIPVTPATGLLLIFPAWLEHRVEPFQAEGERISVAFNVTNP